MADEEKKVGFFARLKSGLTKTRDNIVAGMNRVFLGHTSIDDDFYEELEEIKKAAKEEMDEAVKYADESPSPDPSEVTDDMYTADNERCVARRKRLRSARPVVRAWWKK